MLGVLVQDINPPSFARSASKFRKAGIDGDEMIKHRILVLIFISI